MENYKKEFIEFMVDCGVLKFGDFVTKSGRKTPFCKYRILQNRSTAAKTGRILCKSDQRKIRLEFDVLLLTGL